MKFNEAWKNSEGSWVEPLVNNWLKVGRVVHQRMLHTFLAEIVEQSMWHYHHRCWQHTRIQEPEHVLAPRTAGT
jgi:hypothetical protein